MTETTPEFRLPSFEERHLHMQRARALRSAELAVLVRAAVAWVRAALHIGQHHHGSPVAH